MEERVIDTVPAYSIEIGDRIDAFLNGQGVEVVSIVDNGDTIVLQLEDNVTAEELVASFDEEFDLLGY